ncbi:MAG TPA: ABC transporter permease [Blastocatellia bacterium]|nr:ABC transporter permease [Blastocatellia bacterium]
MKFWRQRKDEDLDAEIQQHLEMAERERIERGESAEQARLNVQREFGNVGLVKEVTREMWGWASLERLWQDVRFGARMLRKQPGFALTAILTLALGIGATTAIFSVVYAVVLRPLPFADSERLVALWTQTPQSERLPMAAANHRDLQAQNTVFEDIAIVHDIANFNLTGDGEPEWLRGARLPANLFPLLRVTPLLGRGFTAEENQPGQEQAVLLSHTLWQRRYGADVGIVGKTVRLGNVPHTVVGVMGPEFQYPSREVQIWVPLTINPADFQTRTGFRHLAVARLKPGVTIAQAQADVSAIAARLAQQYPQVNSDVRFQVTPLRQDMASVAQKPLLVLLGAALGLLLIGCCNLANLLLARALTRSRESAVRAALGATPTRLLLQAAAELVPLLALGFALGVFAAREGIQLFLPWLPPSLPRVEEIAIHLPVLLFSGALLLIAAALVLLVPLLQVQRSDPAAALREDARIASDSKARIRNLLVVGQVALTVMLLAGAGLLMRTFAALKEINPGFRSSGVLSLRLAIPRTKYKTDAEVAAFCQRLLEQVRALPGVEVAGMSHRLPLEGASGLSTIEYERTGQAPGQLAATDDTIITPEYFRALGIPLLQGRSFTEQDNAQAPLVVLLDEQVARRAWPGENPIGKRVRSGPGSPWAEVVGVVGHVRHEKLESDQRWQIYWNYQQRARDRMALVVRTFGDANQLTSSVLSAIKAIDPDQPVYAVRTLTDVVNQSLALRWFNTVIVALFAGSSLLLAVIGIYGVIAWTVRQRTREIGIRLALGASRRAVLAQVLQNGLKLAGAGIALGLIGSLLLARWLRSLLFAVAPTDLFTFAAVAIVLVCAALLACWLPAWQASKVDPMIALRHD